jgi:hypothetical protein
MPVYPPTWLPLVKNGYYPHLSKHDAAIWERFLDAYGGNWLDVAYDVALGGFQLADTLGTEAERLGWQYSTALKIDAVLRSLEGVWICEVKPSAGVSAIGGALSYATMAEEDPFTTLPLFPAIITDHASGDIRRVAERLGITVIEVPEAPPAAMQEV